MVFLSIILADSRFLLSYKIMTSSPFKRRIPSPFVVLNIIDPLVDSMFILRTQSSPSTHNATQFPPHGSYEKISPSHIEAIAPV